MQMDQIKTVSTKEIIFNVAVDLFSEKGYSNVSMREIAHAVGIKASSLYKHYESKEDLLESIFEFFRSVLDQTNFPAAGLEEYLKNVTPEEYLNQSFLLFEQVMWNPAIMKIAKIINMEQQRNQSVRQFFTEEFIEKPFQITKYGFDIMLENGLIATVDTAAAAEEYNAHILYLYFEQNFLKDEPDMEEIEKRMLLHNRFFADHFLRKEGK